MMLLNRTQAGSYAMLLYAVAWSLWTFPVCGIGRLTYLAHLPKYWVYQTDRKSSSNSILRIARSSSVTPAVRDTSTISVTWIESHVE